MGKGQYKISKKLLVEMLGLPDGTEVLHIGCCPSDLFSMQRDTTTVIVSHPDIPEAGEGMIIPEVGPWFKHGEGFVSWGIDKPAESVADALGIPERKAGET